MNKGQKPLSNANFTEFIPIVNGKQDPLDIKNNYPKEQQFENVKKR
jgi:hypothetical protein